jgi:hypothetical protein
MVAHVFGDGRGVIRGMGRAALVPGGALAVHQLRFLLAFGPNAGAELTREGHSYLNSLVPWIVALIGVAAGGFLWTLGRALAGHTTVRRYSLSLAALWATCSVCLLAIYVTQELLEALLAVGHPGGLAGIFGYGGWWAIPVAACVGLVLASVLHGARWMLGRIAARTAAVPRPRAPRTMQRHGGCPSAPRPLPALSCGWSLRGPPR